MIVSSKNENTAKTVTADLTAKYDAETNTERLLQKSRHNVSEHNFEGDGNSEWDVDTDGRNLNSKVKLSPSVKYPFTVIGFYWF